MGVKDAFAAMGELIRASGPDWVEAMGKRTLLTLGLIVLLAIVDITVLERGASLEAPLLIQEAIVCVLSLFLWIDAMRLIDPSFRLTFKLFLKLIWICALFLLLSVPALIPFFVLAAFRQFALAIAFAIVAIYVLITKFWFAFFVIDKKERPVRFSWRLTAGITFLPTFVLIALALVPGYVAHQLFLKIPYGFSSPVVFVLTQCIEIAIAFVTYTWLYSLSARWLPVAERLHPDLV